MTLLLLLALLLSSTTTTTAAFVQPLAKNREIRCCTTRRTWAQVASSVASPPKEAAAAVQIANHNNNNNKEQDQRDETTTVTRHDEGNDDDDKSLNDLPVAAVKERLVTLLHAMQGTADELATVQAAVNRLERGWTPILSRDFWNMAVGGGDGSGTWQLLFSTRLAPPADPRRFRLRQLTQRCEAAAATAADNDAATITSGGTWTSTAVWDLVNERDEDEEDDDNSRSDYNAGITIPSPPTFDCSGTLDCVHSYDVVSDQGSSRVALQLQDHTLRLAQGSAVPTNVPALVARLRRGMPAALFDATGLAADTTYLDDTLRIVRYTSTTRPFMEGVRDIFVRLTVPTTTTSPGDADAEKNPSAPPPPKNDDNEEEDSLF